MPTTQPTAEMLMRAANKRLLAQTCRRYADAYAESGSTDNAATFAATADKHDIQAGCIERGEPVPNWIS